MLAIDPSQSMLGFIKIAEMRNISSLVRSHSFSGLFFGLVNETVILSEEIAVEGPTFSAEIKKAALKD
jgi:hypothetical protein